MVSLDTPDDAYQFDRTPTKRIPTIDAVTEQDLDFYRRNGYLVIDEYLSDKEVAAAKDALKRCLDDPTVENQYDEPLVEEASEWTLEELESAPKDVKMDHLNLFLNDFDNHREMIGPAEKEELLEIIRELVHGDPDRFQDMAFVKPPGGSEKPWHQDHAVFTKAMGLELDAPVVGAWVALDAATADNGCLHIVPGSHLNGPTEHMDAPTGNMICDEDVQVDEDVMATLDPGGLLLFDGLLHHGSPPNTSDTHRRALQFHYTASGAQWIEDAPADGEELFGPGDDASCATVR